MKSKDGDRLENCSLENIKLRDHIWVVFAINVPVIYTVYQALIVIKFLNVNLYQLGNMTFLMNE